MGTEHLQRAAQPMHAPPYGAQEQTSVYAAVPSDVPYGPRPALPAHAWIEYLNVLADCTKPLELYFC